MAVALDTRHYDMVIGGRSVPSSSGKSFPAYNPTTNEVLAQVAEGTPEDVNAAVRAARKAFDRGPWPNMLYPERMRILHRWVSLIRENAQDLASLETLNCGKPLMESTLDVANTAICIEYYANLVPRIVGETIPMNGELFDYTLRQPVGVSGQIIPWNFPLLMAAWKLGPALACGNTVVLKPASYTPITALVLASLALEAGLPEGVLNVVTGPGGTVGAAIASHPDVDKIAFTGETITGRQIMQMAAANIKNISLELGGKSPNIVCEDADIEQAVNGSLLAVYGNSGQRCTARTRLFLHDVVHDRFLERFVDKANRIRVGDPILPNTQMGPLVSPQQLDKVKGFIEIARGEGAELACGGRPPSDKALARGNFMLPTAFAGVKNTMRLAREEVFGPVLSVLRFKDYNEVVELANDTPYGLAGTIWTKDIKRAHRLARAIRAGDISINNPTVNYIEAPFGGFKQSGIGRELGFHAIELYTEIKNVVVDLSENGVDWYKL